MAARSLLSALLLLTPSLAAGQTAQTENTYAADPKAQFRKGPNTRELGPFFLTPKILVDTLGVDTNVNYSSEAPVQDNSLLITGSLDVLLPIGRHVRLSAYGGLTPNYFGTQEDARSLDRFGSLRAELDVGPVTPFGFVGGGRAKQRFSTEVDDRLWRDESSWGVGLMGRLTRKLTLTASGTEFRYRFDSGVVVSGTDVKTALDHISRIGMGDLSYALSKRTDLIARAELIEDHFSDDPLLGQDSVRSYRYLVGPSFTAASRIGGQFLIGLRRFPDSAAASAPSYDGLALDARLSLPMGEASLTLLATRDVRYAVARSEVLGTTARNTLVSSVYGADTSISLPLGFLLRPSVRLERADYILPYPINGVFLPRADNTWTVGGGLLKRFGERVAIGGMAEHYWRSSDLSGFDYSGTRYGLTAEILP